MPTIPVGPSYDERLSPSRAIRTGSEASPVTDTGRVWGTSARSAPSVTTSWVPSASASSITAPVKVRQRIDGSVPTSRIRSRGARGTRASNSSTLGHTISRVSPPTSFTLGRVAWKS